MSELTVAVVAEGESDQVVIEAALKAILGVDSTFLRLKPEPNRQLVADHRGLEGEEKGWCGVFQWCQQYRQNAGGLLENHPLFAARRFDLLVLHLDADVAEKRYTDCSNAIATEAATLEALPCVDPVPPPCPPAQPATDALRTVLRSWLLPTAIGPHTLICIPSKAIDSWIAAALPDDSNIKLQGDVECDPAVRERLKPLRKELRIRGRSSREYAKHTHRIIAEWSRVCASCSQARRFQDDVLAAVESRRRAGPGPSAQATVKP